MDEFDLNAEMRTAARAVNDGRCDELVWVGTGVADVERWYARRATSTRLALATPCRGGQSLSDFFLNVVLEPVFPMDGARGLEHKVSSRQRCGRCSGRSL